MSIVASDLKYLLSGGAGNTDPNLSLGGIISTTEIVDSVKDNLFDDVTGTQHSAGYTDYRCLYVKNAHGTLTLTSAVVWIASETTGVDSDISIAVGTAAVNGVEQTVASETDAPSGVSWSNTALSRAAGLALGDIPAGQHKAVWIKRVISAGVTPQAGDTAQLQAGGDTL